MSRVAAVVAGMVAVGASAQTLSVPCSEHTTLARPDPLPDVSYSKELTLHVDASPFVKSALLRFDLSSVAPGTPVSAVSLTVAETNLGGAYDAFALSRPVDFPTATWELAGAGQPWQLPGAQGPGDRGQQLVFVLGAPGALPFTDAGVQLVQQWVDAPDANYGLIIEGSTGPGNAVYVVSAEDPTASSRPLLALTFADGGTRSFQQGVGGYGGAADTTIIGAPPAFTSQASVPLYAVFEPGVPMGVEAVGLLRCPVPAGRVQGATLTVTNTSVTGTPRQLWLAQVPWVAAEADWLRRSATQGWADAGASGGADRGSAPVSTATISAPAGTFDFDDAGLAAIEAWASGAPNYGFVVTATTSLVSDGMPPTLNLDYGDGGLLPAVDAGAGDGGADAGLDAGAGPDAGSDAGTPADAGAPSPDAGAPAEQILEVRCGCGSTAGPAAGLLMLFTLRRQRHRARRPPLCA